jgi:N-acetylglucosamine-6-sulfatase
MAELYNLKSDPGELVNMIDDPASAQVIATLQAELARLMADTGLTPRNDRMPVDAGIGQALPDKRIR